MKPRVFPVRPFQKGGPSRKRPDVISKSESFSRPGIAQTSSDLLPTFLLFRSLFFSFLFFSFFLFGLFLFV